MNIYIYMYKGSAQILLHESNSLWSLIDFSVFTLIVLLLNTMRPRQIGHHFADDIFKFIFLNENDVF